MNLNSLKWSFRYRVHITKLFIANVGPSSYRKYEEIKYFVLFYMVNQKHAYRDFPPSFKYRELQDPPNSGRYIWRLRSKEVVEECLDSHMSHFYALLSITKRYPREYSYTKFKAFKRAILKQLPLILVNIKTLNRHIKR